MDQSDFFKSIDAKVSDHEQSKQTEAKARLETSEITRKAIAQVRPILEAYKAKLEERGIEAHLAIAGHSGDYLVFELKYGEGGHYGFEMKDGHIGQAFTENGGSYRGGGSCGPGLVNRKLPEFEAFVQTTIESFMRQAPKYGGFLRRH